MGGARFPLTALAFTAALSGCFAVETEAGIQAPPIETLGLPSGETTLLLVNTNLGTLVIAVYTEVTPITASNFVNLSRNGFYDGTRFHRVVAAPNARSNASLVQGGDPTTRDVTMREHWGTGGPGHAVPDEFPRDEQGFLILRHDRAGVLSMVRHGPDAAGSQFTITLDAAPGLDGEQAIFGHVVRGLDVLRAMSRVPTDENDVPREDILIRRVFG